jgi:hypothetical protein
MLRRTSPIARSCRDPTSGLLSRVGSNLPAYVSLLVSPEAANPHSLRKQRSPITRAAFGCRRRVWTYEAPVDFERAPGLRQPLIDVLRMSPCRCLVVFDGMEAYSDRALRLAARFVTELLAAASAHVHLLFSLQFQSADAKLRQLASLKMPQELLEITPIGRPELYEIQELLSPFPDLQWLALRPQLRPLLTNLKVLDWFARTPPKSQAGDDQQYVGLTAVIDQLWELWTESPADGLVAIALSDEARYDGGRDPVARCGTNPVGS